MISKEIIEKTKEFGFAQTKEYKRPAAFGIDLANRKGQELTEALGSDRDIVLMGTLLMDCRLGSAISENRIKEHIQISYEAANEFLSQFPELNKETKENILYCVKQHHGVEKFYSLEAEICCNADCYKFISVEGIVGHIRYAPDTDLKELTKRYSLKADEKWNTLTLDMCKKELEPQYKAIKEFLSKF